MSGWKKAGAWRISLGIVCEVRPWGGGCCRGGARHASRRRDGAQQRSRRRLRHRHRRRRRRAEAQHRHVVGGDASCSLVRLCVSPTPSVVGSLLATVTPVTHVTHATYLYVPQLRVRAPLAPRLSLLQASDRIQVPHWLSTHRRRRLNSFTPSHTVVSVLTCTQRAAEGAAPPRGAWLRRASSHETSSCWLALATVFITLDRSV